VTYDELRAAFDEICTCLCIWREGRGCSPAAQAGIYWVIRNRVADPRWPNTAAEVVLQPWQFSAFNSGDPNSTRFPRHKDAPDYAAWQRILAMVASPPPDPTGGAVFYELCPDDDEPSWAKQRAVVFRADGLEFYR